MTSDPVLKKGLFKNTFNTYHVFNGYESPAADIKMQISVLIRSLKSTILSSTIQPFNMDGQGNPANPNNPADPGNLDGDANPGAAQAAAAAGLVLPGQLVTLPVFDGE